MFSSIGLPEILIVFAAILLLFGGRKIPQLARDLGTGIREFKRSLINAKDSVNGINLEERIVIEDSPSIAQATKRKSKKRTRRSTKKV